ncbi:MAG: efflux RND transporter periplasmic adaptor subunit [Bdellovibrionales bacterium]|nr:efflux RND transporter periplasmic adaptor subunit [Bdellovibrionales bacterium]
MTNEVSNYSANGCAQIPKGNRSLALNLLAVYFAWSCWSVLPVYADDDHDHAHAKDSHGHGHQHNPGHEGEHAEELLRLSDEQLTEAGISLATVGPAAVERTLRLFGVVHPDQERVAHISPRFPGVVRKVLASVGDQVQPGEVLAQVEANESLRSYELSAVLGGTILERHATVGEFVDGSSILFTIANLDSVWIDLQLYPKNFGSVRVGQDVHVYSQPDGEPVTAKIHYLAPTADPHTQGRLVRVVLPNAERRFVPGLFIEAQVVVERREAERAVLRSAVQEIEGRPTVFVRHGGGFEPRVVSLGEKGARFVEVRDGLRQGEQYAASESYTLKSQLLASEADHGHSH